MQFLKNKLDFCKISVFRISVHSKSEITDDKTKSELDLLDFCKLFPIQILGTLPAQCSHSCTTTQPGPSSPKVVPP